MYGFSKAAARGRNRLKQKTMTFGPWSGGLLTERQAEVARVNELSEALNFVLVEAGIARTRDGTTQIGQGAQGAIVAIGEINVNGNWYTVISDDTNRIYTVETRTETVTYTISSNAASANPRADTYQTATGDWAWEEEYLLIGDQSGSYTQNHTSVFIFSSVKIPPASIISSATLKITTESGKTLGGGDDLDARLYGLANGSVTIPTGTDQQKWEAIAPVYLWWSFLENPDWTYNENLTEAYTTPIDGWTSWTDETEYSLDATSPMQEVVNRSDFAYGNTIGFALQGTNNSLNNIAMVLYGYKLDSAKAPQIEVTYTSPAYWAYPID